MMIQTDIEVFVSSYPSRPRSATLFTDKQPGTSTTISAQKTSIIHISYNFLQAKFCHVPRAYAFWDTFHS